jgi:hypothetical protein
MMVRSLPAIISATSAAMPADGKVETIVTGGMKLSYKVAALTRSGLIQIGLGAIVYRSPDKVADSGTCGQPGDLLPTRWG